MDNSKISKRYLKSGFLLSLVVIGIFLPILIMNIYIHHNNDFDLHIKFAESLISQGNYPPVSLPHPIWHILVICISFIPVFSIRDAALVVQLSGYIFLSWVLYSLFNEFKNRGNPLILLVILPLSLMIVSPLFLFVFSNGKYYLGYIGITTYHNPTINLLKPFALLNLIFGVKIFSAQFVTIKSYIWACLITAFSLLVKPSMMICFLPALGCMVVISLLKRQSIQWRFLIIGFILPSIVILIWQYFVNYSGNGEILFAPFSVMHIYSNHLLWNFILSIWFPILVTARYFKEAIQDKKMQIAWFAFGIGAFYSYFLAEAGEIFTDGNFIWCGEITLFVLFVVSTLFFIKICLSKPKLRLADWGILLVGYSPHVIAGIIYYIYCLTQNTYI